MNGAQASERLGLMAGLSHLLTQDILLRILGNKKQFFSQQILAELFGSEVRDDLKDQKVSG